MPAFTPVQYAAYPLLTHWEAIGCTDVAGATPASILNDPLARITDHGPNAVHKIQATEGSRGLLLPTGGPNSLPAVSMDGSADHYWLTQHLCPAQSTWFIVANLAGVDVADVLTFYCGYRNSLQLRMSAGKAHLVAAVEATIGISSGGVAANTWFALSVALDYINGQADFWINGSLDAASFTWPTSGTPAQFRGCGPWVGFGKNFHSDDEFLRGMWAASFGFAGIMGSVERAANHTMISSVAGI